MSSSLVNFPLGIQLKRFTACMIICPCNKWLPQYLVVLVITDANIKNNVAISIAHIHIYNRPVFKTLHHTVNVNSIEAELFAIRCSINQATNSIEISKIIVITDSIHTAKKIFDLLSHLFQTHLASILCKLQSSSLLIKTIQLNSENVLVNATSLFIKWSTKKQNHSISVLSSYTNHLGTTVRKKNVMNYPILGK